MAEPERPDDTLEPASPRQLEQRARQSLRGVALPEVRFVPAGNPSLPTFVSLMLMITTFMIVLTSISLHENSRLRDVLASVRETFSGEPGNSGTSGAPPTGAELLGEVATGFAGAIPLAVIQAPSGGIRLTIAVPLDVVLDRKSGAARRDLTNGLHAMAAALGRRPADLDFEVELRLNDPALGEAHAGALAMSATQAGISADRLFIGAGQGSEGNLLVLVRLDPRAGGEGAAP